MIIKLNKTLKAIRYIGLNISIIPRDIIPIDSYFRDLYPTSITTTNETFIPQEKKYMSEQSYGFYNTCISLLRSYLGDFCVPNQITPPPLKLWNPPLGDWPLQPLSYQYQTVPTYKSDTITIDSEEYYLICSGYGVYDLKDWTGITRELTETARKILLKSIIRPQSYNDLDYLTIIDNCSTTSNNVSPFGYGNFQRFLCGPGIQLNYQPGTSDGANPTVASGDWPIAFPDFLGNVWGPYDAPGDRFQKMGLRDVIQDLFLNGDLDNLNGEPIIKKDVKVEDIMSDSNYGLTSLNKLHCVNFSNFRNSLNPNIMNAMRVVPNGFGAASVIAEGTGTLYTSQYQSAGGMGPNNLGLPNAWSTTGIYGAASYNDPTAVGPNSLTLLTNGTVPKTSVSDLPPNNTEITHKISWYDTGANNGYFIKNMQSYFRQIVTEVPSTNLIVKAFQFERSVFSQSTNSEAGSAVFNFPIRLLPSTSSDGGVEYMEGLYALMSQSSDLGYWGQQFLSPIASMSKINLTFTTYEGNPIPLEKMLSYKDGDNTDLSPNLRSRKYMNFIFRFECYQYVNVGLMDNVRNILNQDVDNIDTEDEEEFMVKASNYQDYS